MGLEMKDLQDLEDLTVHVEGGPTSVEEFGGEG
jgi:hypothetical protein